MSNSSHRALLALAAALGSAFSLAGDVAAQEQPAAGIAASSVRFQVRGPAERMDLSVNGSKVVEFPFDVPRLLVNNPDLVRVTPISRTSVQLSALRAGVTQLNVWDTENNVTTIDINIIGDVAELDLTLKALFPSAALRLRPLNSSLYISGFVPKAEMVASITRVAQDFYPNVINDMTVGGQHKVLLHVRVLEISRTKLRTLGFDWAQISAGGGFLSQSVSTVLQAPGTLIGNTGATVRFGVIGSGGQFYGFVEALRQNSLARLVAEPTLVTLDGRPAQFNVGGQVPIPMQQALGVTTVTYRQFGTQIDFVPTVLGNGLIRLEVRPDVTEIDPSLRDTVTGVPGFRQRFAETAVEMKAGQTLAIAGLVFTREDAVNRGIPWLADMPWIGVPFRRVNNTRNDVELLIFVTPEFCEAMDPSEVPPCGPAQLTTTPTDCELYGRGYIEVPSNCRNGACPPGGGLMGPAAFGPSYEELPNYQSAPAPMKGAQVTNPQTPAVARASGNPARSNATVGTSVAAATSGVARAGGSPDNSQSSHQAPSGQQKSAQVTEATLIGPLGYDDLK